MGSISAKELKLVKVLLTFLIALINLVVDLSALTTG